MQAGSGGTVMQLIIRSVTAANHAMLQDVATAASLSMMTQLQRGALTAGNASLSGVLPAKVPVKSAKFCARVAGGGQGRSGFLRFQRVMVQIGKERRSHLTFVAMSTLH